MPGVSTTSTPFQSRTCACSVVTPAPVAMSSLPVRTFRMVDFPALYCPAKARLTGLTSSLLSSGSFRASDWTSSCMESSRTFRARASIVAVSSAHSWMLSICLLAPLGLVYDIQPGQLPADAHHDQCFLVFPIVCGTGGGPQVVYGDVALA